MRNQPVHSFLVSYHHHLVFRSVPAQPLLSYPLCLKPSSNSTPSWPLSTLVETRISLLEPPLPHRAASPPNTLLPPFGTTPCRLTSAVHPLNPLFPSLRRLLRRRPRLAPPPRSPPRSPFPRLPAVPLGPLPRFPRAPPSHRSSTS